MPPPHELIERALNVHGDATLRAALLLSGDERGAEALLRAMVADLLAAPPAVPLDEAGLLARLLAVARAQDAKRQTGRRREAPRPAADLPPIYRSLFGLPADRRFAISLHLLFGYDIARIARILALDEAAARAELIEAMHAVAPAARISLTDRSSGDHCFAVRAALVDPAGRLRHAPAIRGHLASCAHCRAFDLAWGELSQAVEAALRAALRDRYLPAALEARLAAMTRPSRHFSPGLRFALPPLAVLLLIAAMVLPGITRRAVTIVDRETAAPVDPQALISRSLDIHARPPQEGGPIWHARYQTFWYFDNATMAPLHADIWLDRTNPARHRLQLTHAAGGAPYELQLGNGTDRLYYALDGLYARALYGSLPVRATPEEPALVSEIADGTAQERALGARIGYGVWNIPPFYLRQAQAAPDLRVLGRQRDGDRTVQIVSFSGLSPMGHPADSPGATAERVTVLLALDLADGRLRSATELAGPAGGTQTSRVTWRLIAEDSFGSGADAGSPFSTGAAWNGRGEFPEPHLYHSADPAVPLISATILADPASFLAQGQSDLWLPATQPAGVDRALLTIPSSGTIGQGLPQALIYLGRDRRMIMRFNAASRINGAEEVGSAPLQAQIEPGRARNYRAALHIIVANPTTGRNTSLRILIDTHGFSRAELLAVIDSLRPLDAAILAAQDALFVRPGADSPAARAALIPLLDGQAPPEGQVSYLRALRYTRHNPSDAAMLDPYHRPANDGLPATTLYETWRSTSAEGDAVLLRASDPDPGGRYVLTYQRGPDVWRYDSRAEAVEIWRVNDAPPFAESDLLRQMVFAMLTDPGETLRLASSPAGSVVARSAPLDEGSEAYWYALQAVAPGTMGAEGELRGTTELQLAPDGRPVEIRTSAAAARQGAQAVTLSPEDGVLLTSLQQIEERFVPLAEAPEALRSGQPPQALITRDYRAAPPASSIRVTPESLAGVLALTGSPYYVLPPAIAQINSLEISIGGSSSNSAPYDLGESPLMTAVSVGLASRAIYFTPNAAGSTSLAVQIIQGEARRLGAFLASAEYVPWERSTTIRLNLAERNVIAWYAAGFDAQYLIVALDGQLLIISISADEPPSTLDNLAASLQLVE